MYARRRAKTEEGERGRNGGKYALREPAAHALDADEQEHEREAHALVRIPEDADRRLERERAQNCPLHDRRE